jgi:D-alanine-D-alanine ligase
MSVESKKNIAVIFGGESSEYEISLMSSKYIISVLDRSKYNITKLGITKSGNWFLYSGPDDNIENGSWVNDASNIPAFISPDKKVHGIIALYPDKAQIIDVDVFFPVLHGKMGEDGTIQGLLELSGVPYVGCDTISSAICMDKAVAHSVLTTANIEQSHFLWFFVERYNSEPLKIRNKIIARFTFPVFIKPANAGSSVGISKVESPDGLDSAIKKAAKEDNKIIVEEGIFGQEVECAVIGNSTPLAVGVGEIGSTADFYDYDDKYVNGTSVTYIPAKLKEDKEKEIKEIAVRAYKYIGCSGLARVDFFVEEKTEKVILNEINTLPGFTSISMYPKICSKYGLDGSKLTDELIRYAYLRKSDPLK